MSETKPSSASSQITDRTVKPSARTSRQLHTAAAIAARANITASTHCPTARSRLVGSAIVNAHLVLQQCDAICGQRGGIVFGAIRRPPQAVLQGPLERMQHDLPDHRGAFALRSTT